MGQTRVNFTAMHEELGCDGCPSVDQEQLNKGRCCTFMGGPEIDENGKCLVKGRLLGTEPLLGLQEGPDAEVQK